MKKKIFFCAGMDADLKNRLVCSGENALEELSLRESRSRFLLDY